MTKVCNVSSSSDPKPDPLITCDEINIFVQLVTQEWINRRHNKIILVQSDGVCTQYNLRIGCHKVCCSHWSVAPAIQHLVQIPRFAR